jgi:hypothetical protein
MILAFQNHEVAETDSFESLDVFRQGHLHILNLGGLRLESVTSPARHLHPQFQDAHPITRQHGPSPCYPIQTSGTKQLSFPNDARMLLQEVSQQTTAATAQMKTGNIARPPAREDPT